MMMGGREERGGKKRDRDKSKIKNPLPKRIKKKKQTIEARICQF